MCAVHAKMEAEKARLEEERKQRQEALEAQAKKQREREEEIEEKQRLREQQGMEERRERTQREEREGGGRPLHEGWRREESERTQQKWYVCRHLNTQPTVERMPLKRLH